MLKEEDFPGVHNSTFRYFNKKNYDNNYPPLENCLKNCKYDIASGINELMNLSSSNLAEEAKKEARIMVARGVCNYNCEGLYHHRNSKRIQMKDFLPDKLRVRYDFSH